MGKIYSSVTELAGRTPLVRLHGTEKKCGLNCRLLAKVEYFNPTGSVKDRVALAMIEQLEGDGALKAGGVIIEPTSGNTGIGLAAMGTARGYKVVIVMPDTMSAERVQTIKAYGRRLCSPTGSREWRAQ